ncbi:MAG TPA: ABC transporter ATP-binding protein [Acidimicrobiales bacterium]|nr:ABC transporter ATP-binding protein [Acidimicrobiales bacterium]
MTAEGAAVPAEPPPPAQAAEAAGRPASSLRRLPELVRLSLGIAAAADRRTLAWLISLQSVAAALAFGQVLVVRSVVAAVAGSAAGAATAVDVATVLPPVAALVTTTVLISVADAATAERQRYLAELIAHQARQRLLGIAVRADFATLEAPAYQDRLTRALTDAATRPFQVTAGVVGLLANGLVATTVWLALVRVQPVLAVAALLSLVPLAVAARADSRDLYDTYRRLTPLDRRIDDATRLVVDATKAKELRTLGASAFLRRRYDDLAARRVSEIERLTRHRQRRALLANACVGLSLVVTAGVAALLVARRDLELAGAAAALVALQLLTSRLRLLHAGGVLLLEGALFLDDYRALGVEGPDEPPPPAEEAPRSLALRNVSFRYPGSDRLVLRDVSVEVATGEIVAIVGSNGSGKTTLAKLLVGLYEPTAGEVRIDGHPAGSTSRLRAVTAALFQDFVRYPMTAAENVALDDVDVAGLDGVRRAAAATDADELLSKLPQGYDTVLDRTYEGGSDLSTGQWQRVALARAVHRGASFVVLDEPTSSLDAIGERVVYDLATRALASSGVVLISHRLATIRSADRIYVLEGGAIVQAGTHDDLIRAPGLYAALFGAQGDPAVT